MLQKDDCPFVEIEYLEVNNEGGQAWIDTEFVPEGNDIEIRFHFVLNGYVGFKEAIPWIIAKSSASSNAYGVESYTLADFINAACGKRIERTSWNYLGTNYPLNYVVSLGYEMAYFNTNKWSTGYQSQVSGAENKSSLKLFSNIEGSYVKGRLHYLQLDKAGVTVLDLIPVRVGVEGFMYDRVSGKLMGNSGTGKFVLGPDI